MPQEAYQRSQITYFTICSRNFLAYARTLYNSLIEHNPDSKFVVALCDEPAHPFVAANEPFEFVYLDDLALPEWREMSARYNITEFNTSVKPFVFQHLFERVGSQQVVYLDPDIYVTGPFDELKSAFNDGYSAILTPHMLEPAEDAEMNEKRLLQYGIYNLGFLGLRNTEAVRKIVKWWGRRLITDCVIKREEGLFVDQKWADHFPAFIADTLVLRHPGYNVAYWNLANRQVVRGQSWEVNGEPLRFIHFSGNGIDEPDYLSRHSDFTVDKIGDLKFLLNEYHASIIGNGHRKYQQIPYAFAWNGARGCNEHTPAIGAGKGATRRALRGRGSIFLSDTSGRAPDSSGSMRKVQPTVIQMITTAVAVAGGPLQFVSKATRVMRRGGMEQAIQKLVDVQRIAANRAAANQSPADDLERRLSSPLPWRRKVLFIDSSTPRPDNDSGSRTCFHFLEILTMLGYEVDFLPRDFLYAGGYTRALENLGVRCLHSRNAKSLLGHIREAGELYDFVMLSRVHAVSDIFDALKNHIKNAKFFFNTVDLHYVRQLRSAQLSGSDKERAEAIRTKADELRLALLSDETIVVSRFEQDELARELPSARVRVLPLLFSEGAAAPPGPSGRQDIVFIGSFAHLPNVDAVLHFAKTVFPKLHEKRPDIVWHIIGSDGPPDVVALGQVPGIVVHGHVQDLADIFRRVRLSIAPLRFGAGIKGKIATSLAYGVPVVASSVAVEGMAVDPSQNIIVADTPDEFLAAIEQLHDDEDRWSELSARGRELCQREYSVAANTLRIAEMMKANDPDFRDLDLISFRSQEEFAMFQRGFGDRIAARRAFERLAVPEAEEPFRTPGFCACSGGPTKFVTSFMYACHCLPDGALEPNWREHMACECCAFTSRIRASMHAFMARYYCGPESTIYVTEQMTPLYRWLKARHANLVGSEFLSTAVPLGDESKGLRNEDLTRLTFADRSFDAILSFDVLEHVTDDLAAFRECYRCLKPGGVLFFTAPFADGRGEKLVRAEVLSGGEIKHHMEPEIHGNPADPQGGALCYRYFAWDVIDDLKRAGFASAEVLNYWSAGYGYLGRTGYLVVARKDLR